MREILFRGKRVDNNEWVYGYYVKATHHWHDHGIHRDWIAVYTIQNGGWCNIFGKYAVVSSTVGEYTGLTDKNGKKIFEGDIVKIDDKYIRYVVYSGVSAGFVKMRYINRRASEGGTTLGYGYDAHKHTVEVIGNIHDNHELVEVIK